MWPGDLGEVIPQIKTIRIGKIEDVEEPDFRWRGMRPGDALWGQRNKLGGVIIGGGHSYEQMASPEKYGKSHPEYFSLVNGERGTERSQLCTSNPEVIQVCVDYVRKYFDEHPEVDVFSVSPNDWENFCECEHCRALDPVGMAHMERPRPPLDVGGPGHKRYLSDRIFTFANAVAEEISKTHPDKYLIVLAYAAYVDPPEQVKVHKNVIAWYCVSCVGHWHEPRKEADLARLKAWKQVSDHIAIFEYYINQSWPNLHRVVTPLIKDSIVGFHNGGVRFYRTQAGDDFAITGLNYYVASKLLWDKDLDLEEILSDYYDKGYGVAGRAMRRYFECLAGAWREATIRGDLPGSDVVLTPMYLYDQLLRIFTPQVLEDCRRHLDEAEQLAEDDTIRARIELMRKGFQYTDLTMEAVRTTKEIEEMGVPEFNIRAWGRAGYDMEQAKTRVKDLGSEKIWEPLSKAIAAWERRSQFMEEVKGQTVISAFWSTRNTSFDPTDKLNELLGSLGMETK